MESVTYWGQCCGNCVWSNEVGDGHGVCCDRPWRQNLSQLRAAFIEDMDEPTECPKFAPVYGVEKWTA